MCNVIVLIFLHTLLLLLMYADTAKTSLSSQEASEPSQGLQLAAIDSSILRHRKEAKIDSLRKLLEAAKALEGKSLLRVHCQTWLCVLHMY